MTGPEHTGGRPTPAPLQAQLLRQLDATPADQVWRATIADRIAIVEIPTNRQLEELEAWLAGLRAAVAPYPVLLPPRGVVTTGLGPALWLDTVPTGKPDSMLLAAAESLTAAGVEEGAAWGTYEGRLVLTSTAALRTVPPVVAVPVAAPPLRLAAPLPAGPASPSPALAVVSDLPHAPQPAAGPAARTPLPPATPAPGVTDVPAAPTRAAAPASPPREAWLPVNDVPAKPTPTPAPVMSSVPPTPVAPVTPSSPSREPWLTLPLEEPARRRRLPVALAGTALVAVAAIGGGALLLSGGSHTSPAAKPLTPAARIVSAAPLSPTPAASPTTAPPAVPHPQPRRHPWRRPRRQRRTPRRTKPCTPRSRRRPRPPPARQRRRGHTRRLPPLPTPARSSPGRPRSRSTPRQSRRLSRPLRHR